MTIEQVGQKMAWVFLTLILVFLCSLLVLGIVSVWREIL